MNSQPWPHSRARRWTQGAAALTGMLLLAGGAWWTLVGAGARSPGYDSIAVLPFVNMSGDPADDYFGDGLAEELLNALSAIDGLKVAARSSAFAFRGGMTDVRTIGDTLRVAAVLEGSVRRSTDRVRISAQLIDARTGYRLWSETYDHPLADLWGVETTGDELIGRLWEATVPGAPLAEAAHRYRAPRARPAAARGARVRVVAYLRGGRGGSGPLARPLKAGSISTLALSHRSVPALVSCETSESGPVNRDP
jgi:TolB-like protein